ncbi:MAG TPA: zf-HC2 domain-containing protein [Polyangiaceae bacterium]|nr:zf-HC2 domain-containing protein [Polyangiaceae bacterium]
MDCEKFDQIVLDLLYDELDEITSAAAKRHMEHCARCKEIGTRLRATREVGALPLLDAPQGLELRILEAERRARRELPARQRLGRAVSMLAGYAMRPQLAMAALLLLVIGSSLLLLRARPGEQKSMMVTERGVPEGEPETVAVVPRATPRDAAKAKQTDAPAGDERRAEAKSAAERPSLPAAPPPAAAAKAAEAAASRSDELSDGAAAARAGDSDRAYAEALGAYRDRRYDEAQRRFSDVASRGGDNAASAALYAAQSARARSGCPTATPLFDDVYRRYPDSPPGREAAWQAAGCYRTLGDFERARREYELLLQAPGYADRAQAALASLGDAEPSEVAARKAAPAASHDKGAAATGAAPRAAGRPADNDFAPPPAKPSP